MGREAIKETAMLSAYDTHNDSILAKEAHKESGPYHCLECSEEVFLKRGSVKIAHFAHFPNSLCPYAGEPESILHSNVKLEIYDALTAEPGVTKLQLERPLKEVRPDISFLYEGRSIALEVQISPLSLDDLIRRTTAYGLTV